MPLLNDAVSGSQLLSNNTLVAGVIETIIQRDDLFSVLPFVGVNGKAYVYNQEDPTQNLGIGAGSGVTFLSPNDPVLESAATFKEIVATLKILAGDVDVDKFIQTVQSDTNSQLAIQIQKKAKSVAWAFHQTLATGDASANPKAFDGLASFFSNAMWGVPASQTVPAAGTVATPAAGALTLTALDALLDSVPLGADVVIMRRGTIRAFRALLRATYGTDAVMQQLENFGRPMLTHNGVPIIMNEFLSATETFATTPNTCSVYAVRLNELDGLHGIYGGPDAGFVVENIGTVQNKDATRIRLKWYTSVVLKSTRSIGRLAGVTNV